MSAIPVGWHLCDGTDGTPNLIGQFLQGSSIPGNFIEAGLPNIKGQFSGGHTSNVTYSGAFSKKNSTGTGIHYCIGDYGGPITQEFNASLANSIYKDECTTVQPPAYTVYYIIKVS